MTEYSRQGFDYGIMVDPEPHRCRRTDGKKWRCSKNVVPNQKYCERHMHRGRNRSRKPVEASEDNSPLITKPSSKLYTLLASNPESAVSSPTLLGTQLIDMSSCTPSRSHSIANSSSTNNRLKHIIDAADYNTTFSPAPVVSPGSTFDTAVAPKATKFSSMTLVASDNRSRLNMCKKDNQTKSCISNNISVRSGGKGSTTCDSNCNSTGIGFSPRSVLQGNIGEFATTSVCFNIFYRPEDFPHPTKINQGSPTMLGQLDILQRYLLFMKSHLLQKFLNSLPYSQPMLQTHYETNSNLV